MNICEKEIRMLKKFLASKEKKISEKFISEKDFKQLPLEKQDYMIQLVAKEVLIYKEKRTKKLKKFLIFSCIFLLLIFSINVLGRMNILKFDIKITEETIKMHSALNSDLNIKSYSSIKQVENEFGISILKIKEIPKGYKLNDINVYVDNNDRWYKLYIYYLNGDAQISYVLSNSHNFRDTSIEKNVNLIEIHKIDNIDIYLSQNDYWNSAAWYDNNIKYEIYGSLSIDEIKKMVDSVYN